MLTTKWTKIERALIDSELNGERLALASCQTPAAHIDARLERNGLAIVVAGLANLVARRDLWAAGDRDRVSTVQATLAGETWPAHTRAKLQETLETHAKSADQHQKKANQARRALAKVRLHGLPPPLAPSAPPLPTAAGEGRSSLLGALTDRADAMVLDLPPRDRPFVVVPVDAQHPALAALGYPPGCAVFADDADPLVRGKLLHAEAQARIEASEVGICDQCGRRATTIRAASSPLGMPRYEIRRHCIDFPRCKPHPSTGLSLDPCARCGVAEAMHFPTRACAGFVPAPDGAPYPAAPARFILATPETNDGVAITAYLFPPVVTFGGVRTSEVLLHTNGELRCVYRFVDYRGTHLVWAEGASHPPDDVEALLRQALDNWRWK